MEQFTPMEWLEEQLSKKGEIAKLLIDGFKHLFDQAKVLEYTAEDVKEAYNAGYSDCECNHVSEAGQYIHDLSYIKIQQQNKIIKDYEELKEDKPANPRRRRRS